MKIIEKYYDKNFRLRKVTKNTPKTTSLIRFKILRNGKEFPCCDYRGRCTNKSYAEVFPRTLKNSKRKGWSYLCRKHYYEEERRLNWKLPACLKVEW